MGLSEWGILIRTNHDITLLKQCICDHNSNEEEGEVGEELDLYCFLKFNNNIWACIGNEGGRNFTSNFLDRWYNEHNIPINIYYPFDKPNGWSECKDYIWQGKLDTAPDVIF